MAVSFDQLMQGFGVVTVMDAVIYRLKDEYSYSGRSSCKHAGANDGALVPSCFECTGLCLDTLKIANLTMEGPTKTITGGQYANPLIKYGKTMTMEAQDALGRAATLVEFFGCEYVDNERLSVTDIFPGAFAMEGKTFFIDQKSGEKCWVHIFIPQFLPDGIFNLTQDAEGDATVFDLNGAVCVTSIADSDSKPARDIFYEIRDTSWFANMNAIATGEHNYHDDDVTALDGVKNEAIASYKEYCGIMGYTPVESDITAIKDAATETAVQTALKTAMGKVTPTAD